MKLSFILNPILFWVKCLNIFLNIYFSILLSLLLKLPFSKWEYTLFFHLILHNELKKKKNCSKLHKWRHLALCLWLTAKLLVLSLITMSCQCASATCAPLMTSIFFFLSRSSQGARTLFSKRTKWHVSFYYFGPVRWQEGDAKLLKKMLLK